MVSEVLRLMFAHVLTVEFIAQFLFLMFWVFVIVDCGGQNLAAQNTIEHGVL